MSGQIGGRSTSAQLRGVGLEALRQSGRLGPKAKIIGYKAGFKLLALCPFHRETTPSFAVFDNGDYCARGGYKCQGCGASGHISELEAHLGIVSASGDQHREPIGLALAKTALEPARLDLAYCAGLAAMSLRATERRSLTGRGLSADDIATLEAQGYRSAPSSWSQRCDVGAAIVGAVGDGFAGSLPCLQSERRSRCGWICAGIPGLLFPVKDAAGKAVACKVRGVGYFWWRAKGSGASTGAPIHVNKAPGATLAIVVEGPIKADLVAMFWPRIYGEAVTVLAIPGASCHGGLSDVLTLLGLRRVVLALDQDPAGRKTTEDLMPRLARIGFDVSVASWPDPTGGKVKIDDFLVDRNTRHQDLERTRFAIEEPTRVEAPLATMEAARDAARRWLREALTCAAGVYHMALEMGGGKTHLAVELVNELYNAGKLKGQAGLFTTRHEQGEQFAGTEEWATHYGATYGFENGEAADKSPCKEPLRMLAVVNSGAPANLACERCPQRAVCASNFARTPGRPFYLAQKSTLKDRHLYNVNSLRDPAAVSGLSVIFLDDLDLERALVDRADLDSHAIRKALLWARRDAGYTPIEPLLSAMWATLPLIPGKQHTYDSPRLNGEELQDALATQFGGFDNLHAALENAVSAKDPAPLNDAGEVRVDMPHRAFLRLAKRLKEELHQRGQGSWSPMVHVKPDGISFWTRSHIDFTGKTVIILNAGQGAEQYQRIFPSTPSNG